MERLTPGIIVSFTDYISDLEIEQEVTKEFLKKVYIFMLGRGEILNLGEYFKSRYDYRMQGHIFNEDLTEIFVDNHRVWKIW